jgi:hypothetical protein
VQDDLAAGGAARGKVMVAGPAPGSPAGAAGQRSKREFGISLDLSAPREALRSPSCIKRLAIASIRSMRSPAFQTVATIFYREDCLIHQARLGPARSVGWSKWKTALFVDRRQYVLRLFSSSWSCFHQYASGKTG